VVGLAELVGLLRVARLEVVVWVRNLPFLEQLLIMQVVAVAVLGELLVLVVMAEVELEILEIIQTPLQLAQQILAVEVVVAQEAVAQLVVLV
jgi:hypothetical protein